MPSSYSDVEEDVERVESRESSHKVDDCSTISWTDHFDYDSFFETKETNGTIAEHKLEKSLVEFILPAAIEQHQKGGFDPNMMNDVQEKIKNELANERERLIVHLLKKICSFRDPSNQLFILCCSWFFKRKIITSKESFTACSEPKLSRVLTSCNEKDELLLQWLDISTYKRDYVEEELLGSGGFGAVFKARHKVDGRYYAVKKIMFRCHQFVTHITDTILREVQVLSRVTSNNVARYYGAFIEQRSEAEAIRFCQEQNINQVTWTASEESTTVQSSFHNFFKEISGSEQDKKNASALQPFPLELQLSEHRMSRQLVNIFPEYGKWNHLQLYLLMEFCGHHTLKDYITAKGRIPNLKEIMSIVVQCLSALETLHLHQIVHRDVKPSNIFLKPLGVSNLIAPEPYFPGVVHTDTVRMRSIMPSKSELPRIDNCVIKLGDFGLSKFCYTHTDFVDRRTSPIVIDECNENIQIPTLTANVGTRFYAAPEIKVGSDYDVKIDIYSLGILFFELLSPPFRTLHERAVALSSIRNNEVPRHIGEKFGNDVAQMLKRMVDPNPVTRASAKELLGMEVVKGNVANGQVSKGVDQNNGLNINYDEARKQYESLSKSELIDLIIKKDKTLSEQGRLLAVNGSASEGLKKQKSQPHPTGG